MVDFILELIDFNEGIDYSIVTKIIVIYLILLWVFVSVWVFNDARYRFNNLIIASLLALLNLFLSFPFLLIYLLIRPSHRDEWDESLEDGGISIPLVNFTDKEGIAISLNLKIDSKKILDEKVDYKLSVSLDKENEPVNQRVIKEQNIDLSGRADTLLKRINNKFKSISSALSKGLIKLKGLKYKPSEAISLETQDIEEIILPSKKQDSLRSNKKKRKTKNKKRK